VLDAGCGPGHVTAHLAGLGLDARGLDLSPAMVEQARRLHPTLRFDAGTVLDLPAADATLAGITALYSLIHLDDAELRTALREFHRALRPGGLLLIAVHAGDEVRHADELCGVPVDLDFRFHQPAALAARLEEAGLAVDAVLERRAHTPHEVDTRRVYMLARRPT